MRAKEHPMFDFLSFSCPFPFVKFVVLSTALLCLLYPAYKNNNQTYVCATGMYREMRT